MFHCAYKKTKNVFYYYWKYSDGENIKGHLPCNNLKFTDDVNDYIDN